MATKPNSGESGNAVNRRSAGARDAPTQGNRLRRRAADPMLRRFENPAAEKDTRSWPSLLTSSPA